MKENKSKRLKKEKIEKSFKIPYVSTYGNIH